MLEITSHHQPVPRISPHPRHGRCMAKFHILQPRQCHVLQHRHTAWQIPRATRQLSGTAAAKEALKQGRAASQYLAGTQTDQTEPEGSERWDVDSQHLFGDRWLILLCVKQGQFLPSVSASVTTDLGLLSWPHVRPAATGRGSSLPQWSSSRWSPFWQLVEGKC